METVIVAAGLIIEERKILVTQRKEDAHQGLLWEFPGGKVMETEEPRQALKRELREELGIEAEVGAMFEVVFHTYPEFSVLLLVYRCRIRKGVPQPLACRALQWVDLRDLEQLPMPPADTPVRSSLLLSKEEPLAP